MTSHITPNNRYSLKRRIQFALAIAFILVVLTTGVGELIVRLTSESKHDDPLMPPYNSAMKDDGLGWKMTPNYRWSGEMQDVSGETYAVDIAYDENGFKAFGNVGSDKPKVLFLGDSYTACIEVSNSASFFRLIGDSLNVEVFAYGHAGFGTLQQYLILAAWFEKIAPDLVVWQVCSNDYIDNYAPLDIRSGYGVGERRPYLNKRGQIVYLNAISTWERITKKIRFYAWLDARFRAIKKKVFNVPHRDAGHYIATQMRDYEYFDKAVIVTGRILEKAAETVGGRAHVIGFSADGFQPQHDEFETLFVEAGFEFVSAPHENIRSAEVIDDKVVRARDGWHWNETGHKVIADALIPAIAEAIQDTIR